MTSLHGIVGKPLEAALEYARLGRPVHRLHWVKPNGICSCGRIPCGKILPGYPNGDGAGKHPRTLNGLKDATQDERQIRTWWTETPSANIGLRALPDEIILDIDPRVCGDESIDILQAVYGLLPDTPQAFTGGGGQHFYFHLPGGIHLPGGGSLEPTGFPGVEWKACGGGYVVAPPSNHYTGGTYSWEVLSALGDIPYADAPAWLLDLLLRASDPQKRQASQTGDGQQTSGRGPSWSSTDVQGFFDAVYSEGSRRTATGLPRLVGILASRGHVPVDMAVDFLLSWQESHFAPPLPPEILTNQVQAMYARWMPQTDTVQGHNFLTRLTAPVIEKPSPARTPSYIRAGDGFVEQGIPIKVEQPVVEPPGVARRATVLAARYKDYCIDMLPMPPGVTPRGGSCIMQRKDNPLHLATTAGASQTWQEEGNAVLMRRTRLAFYLALLFDVVEEEDQGAIYHYRRHLSPEIWEENWRWLKRLRARINAHGKNQVEFCVLEEDGWWLNVLSDYDDPRGKDTEPSVAAREDLGPLLAGLGMPDREFHKKTPVYASKAWKMPKSRTNEWRILGVRSVPDLLAYSAEEDARDAQIAIESGFATYLATGEEIMGRAPEAIQHTRHFLAPPETQPWETLFFADRLGFYLFPKIQDELERERGVARAAKRAKPAMAPRPSPMPVPQGKFF